MGSHTASSMGGPGTGPHEVSRISLYSATASISRRELMHALCPRASQLLVDCFD